MENRTKEFTHCVIEGTAYEAGKQLGNMYKDDKEFIELYTSPFMGGARLSKEQIINVMQLYDEYCPGLNDELRGFADAVGAKVEDIVLYYAYLQKVTGNCSHVVVTQQMTYDGQTYLGRNYDFDWNDNPTLITSRIEGQYNQIGFGCQLFGRFDGMNEYGLCVTTSAGVINPDYKEDGFVFPVIVRAILNRCKDVKQAVALLEDMKIADYRNFIIADIKGEAALVEVAASQQAVKYITKQSKEKFLYSTNHYNIDSMKRLGFPKVKHSQVRYDAFEALFKSSTIINKESLHMILSNPMPDGVCCHHYSSGMGTMWSMLFQPMKKLVDICFGSPNANKWMTFDLESKKGKQTYISELPDEDTDKDFWTVE